MRAAGLVAAAAGLAFAAIQPSSAQAAVITVTSNTALSAVATPVILGGGVGSLFFTAATADDGPGAAVATSGTAQVTTIFGQVADYFPGTVFDGTASFAAFPTPATIEFSAGDDFIGFAYTAPDGQHLGYAEVFGPTLVGYAYQTTAGASLTASPIVSAVPEPTSMALLVVGFVGACATYTWRRRAIPSVGGRTAGA